MGFALSYRATFVLLIHMSLDFASVVALTIAQKHLRTQIHTINMYEGSPSEIHRYYYTAHVKEYYIKQWFHGRRYLCWWSTYGYIFAKVFLCWTHRPQRSGRNKGSLTPAAKCPNTVKIASGHLLKLRCKVTQGLLPNVEMNEALVDRVLTNVSSKLMGKFMAHGIQPDDPIATEVRGRWLTVIEIPLKHFIPFTVKQWLMLTTPLW